METKLVVLAAILCTSLLIQNLAAEPLEDALPDTTGLFFGKRRSSHTSSLNRMNRRSYASPLESRGAGLDWRPEAGRFCAMIHTTCMQWGVYDEN